MKRQIFGKYQHFKIMKAFNAEKLFKSWKVSTNKTINFIQRGNNDWFTIEKLAERIESNE